MNKLNAVILAGGAGTRLWPLSRILSPKQLQNIGSQCTLLQDTVIRASKDLDTVNTIFLTSKDLVHEVKRQTFACLGSRAKDFIYIGEPIARNTAPAILLSALIIAKIDPEGLLLVMPSDHIIKEINAFSDAIQGSLNAAREGYLVMYGIIPTRPDTGYGYIKRGDPLEGIFTVNSFEEKPSISKAQNFLADESYYWNSGIFLSSAKTLIEETRLYLPSLLHDMEKIDLDNFSNLEQIYNEVESISIDYGIMEKTDRAAVVPVSMGWSDVGSWDSLYNISDKDDSNNVISGDVITKNSKDNLLFAGKNRIVAVAGLENMIVVDTADALLICPRHQSQSVRDLVEIMQNQKRDQVTRHQLVYRPWGSYTVILENDTFKVKQITVDPEEKLSLQFHHHRNENWVVVSGVALVTKGNDQFTLNIGESVYIPKLTAHRLENPEKKKLEIIEVQDGDYLGEDDIFRIDDIYNRQK